MAGRRAFLKVGMGAALVLALGGGIYRATQPTPARAPLPRFVLDGEARAALQAIVPAMLAGALAPGPAYATDVDGVIARVHAAILSLPLASQKEVQDLFGLLALAPARRLLTGIASPWGQAAPAAVQAFLQDWRVSQFGMLRAGYGALQNLVMAAWYAAPASWAAIGYPGAQLEWAP
ncbi:hypothetical protein [Massilia sp. S19_KUP03_FR1]|uniref:hypothetical protein n=1 Tax=Massilia sp. S19_KUP03_FR1 TaxID=3025503 RepID=UPI002FCD8F8E